jgi:hypothetical protein
VPLSPDLYDLLDHRFGVVRTVNEGRQAVVVFGKSIITGELATRFLDVGEQYLIACPWCGDTTGHLYVSYLYGSADPVSGRPLTHLIRCFRRECQHQPNRLNDFHDLLFSGRPVRTFRPRRGATTEARPWRPVAVPPPCELVPLTGLPSDHMVVAYLRDRGFDLAELEEVWGVAYATEPSRFSALTGRVYVPVRHDGLTVAWQGRWPADLDWKAAGLTKYFNLPGSWKSEVLYNLDLAVRESCVVLVEGVFDVFGLGRSGVALLGKTLSRQQLSLLAARAAGKPVVILLDPPAKDPDSARATSQVVTQLRGRFPGVVKVNLPGGLDPGDCRRCRGPLWDFIEAAAAEQGVTVRRPDD